MLIITCPNCQIRVMPSPEGICPSCRKAILEPVPILQVGPGKACAACKEPLEENATTCAACGFAPDTQVFLATTVEHPSLLAERQKISTPQVPIEAPDINPYAAPMSLEDRPINSLANGNDFVADLTPNAAVNAQSVVGEANRVFWYIFLGTGLCFCIGPVIWAFMLPWYSYRLYSWYHLNRTYSELRNPTPRRSAYYTLAHDFQLSKGRLWVGFIVGALGSIPFTFVVISTAFDGVVNPITWFFP